MVGHPNAKTVWTTIELEAGQPRTVVIVETDLALHVNHPDHDLNKVNELIEACMAYFAANARNVDRMTLKSVTPD